MHALQVKLLASKYHTQTQTHTMHGSVSILLAYGHIRACLQEKADSIGFATQDCSRQGVF
jgi:hypothetical protein